MEKNKKYIWSVAALFSVALIIGSAQMILAQAWQAPNKAFPNQDVNPPIDTGSNFQTKDEGIGFSAAFTGKSALSFSQANQWISADWSGYSFKLIPLTTSGQTTLQSSGEFYMNTKGVVLPREETSGLNATKGMITYSPSQDKVKVYTNSGWVDIGTGTATGGSTYWKANGATGIIYNGNSVTISNAGTTTPDGWYVSSSAASTPPTGSTKMFCDSSPSSLECVNDYYSAPPGNNGDVAYDQYSVSCGTLNNASDPNKNLGMENGLFPTAHAAICYNYKTFTYKKTIPGVNTATLSVGSLTASQQINTQALTIGKLGLSDIKTITGGPIDGRKTACWDSGVKGMVISFLVNGGGSGGAETQFWLQDSLPKMGYPIDSHGLQSSGANLYTIFNDSGDITYGGGNIKVCFPPILPLSDSRAQYIDSIKINYIPLSF